MELSTFNLLADADIQQGMHDMLKYAMSTGLDAAEIDLNIQTGYSVSARLAQLDALEHKSNQDLTLCVYKNNATASVSTTDLTHASIKALIQKANILVDFVQADPYAGLANKDLMALDYPDLDLFHPWDLTPTQAIELVIGMDQSVHAVDDRVHSGDSCDLATTEVQSFYTNSNEFYGQYAYSVHQLSCVVLAADKDGKQQYADYDISCIPSELADPNKLAQKTAKNACLRLGARKIKTQECPVLFSAPLASRLLSTFMKAINGACIYRDSSFLKGAIGERIFPEFVSLMQQPHIKRNLYSSPFDNEGVRTQEYEIVAKGCFSQYICDSYSARKLGCQTTGNAGGVFNVNVTHTGHSFDELLQEMDSGLYVTELLGQGVNLLTGDYSRGAYGFWVENGEIQYPVDEVTIAGNLRQMYQQIIAIGSNIDRRCNIKTGAILIEKMTVAGNS